MELVTFHRNRHLTLFFKFSLLWSAVRTSGVPYNLIFFIENDIVKVIANLFIFIYIVQVLPAKNEKYCLRYS